MDSSGVDDRPYRQHSYYDLEKIFQKSESNLKILQVIASEFEFRSTPYSVILRFKVKDRIKQLSFGLDTGVRELHPEQDPTQILEEELKLAQAEVESLLKDREWLRSRVSDLCERYVVGIGDEVRVRKTSDRRVIEFRILNEAYESGDVSTSAPMAQGALGREVGEEFEVAVGNKKFKYVVVGIEKAQMRGKQTWIAISMRPWSFI